MPTLTFGPIPSPLRIDASGVVRVGDTRVTLDTLVASYRDGSTAEEIAQDYPSLTLRDVHAVIAYYLLRRPEVDEYLQARQHQADLTRRRVEAECDQRAIRQRLLRRAASGGSDA